MSWNGKDLAHVMHSFAVYFVLRRPLDRETFNWVLEALKRRAGEGDSTGVPEEHWDALVARMSGRSRWDSVAPRYTGETKSVEGWRKAAATVQGIENILRLRRYTGYTIEGLSYTVDLFNPANELDMPYAGAGEPVLALLFRGLEREPGPISFRLAENASFYEILKDLDGLLQPEHVCGIEPNLMFSLMWAYVDGRVDPGWRPWDFLFPLHLLRDPPIPLTLDTRIPGTLVKMLPGKEVKLAKAEDWGGGRVLIQIRPGLHAALSWEYFAVAKALGMISVQEVVEGTVPRPDRPRQ